MKTKTHFIGIGGIGMSGLAKLLLAKNIPVSGSDIKETDIIKELKQAGAEVFIGHDSKNLPVGGRVVVSSIIAKGNPELEKALNPCHRSDLLNELMQDHKGCIVAGTHGKTTTSSLLAHVLKDANKSPSYAIGGILKNSETNAELGSGPYFVAEADESDGTHVKYQPYALIVTNIDNDHMDHYGSFEKLLEAFKALIYKVSDYNFLITCGDDPVLKKLDLPGLHYGFKPSNDIQVLHREQVGLEQTFTLRIKDKIYSDIFLPLIGEHNVLNASAVFALSLQLGVSEKEIRCAFMSFKGIRRRADFRFEKKNVRFYDDYAHHPQEIKATLNAFKEAYPHRRLIVVFQPHRYSRLKECFEGFVDSLSADVVILTDLYAASEKPIEGYSTQKLKEHLKKSIYIPRAQLAEGVCKLIRPFDIVISMGAGDITYLPKELEPLPIRNLHLGLIFGGRSTEHEVSFMSARNLFRAVDRNLFDVTLFAISKQGGWVFGEEALAILEDKKSYETETHELVDDVIQKLHSLDCVFPCLHGPYGEDGTAQGFFEIAGIAYVGCSVESSAIAMNKALTKRLCAYDNVPLVPFVDFIEYEWRHNPEKWINKIQSELKFPLFVKPVHLGSTVGVRKITNPNDLAKVIDEVFHYDSHIIVETGIEGREIEFSIIGSGPYTIFNPGEICAKGSVYDYEAKYGENAIEAIAVAPLSNEEKEKGKEIALKAYQAIRADGMARVDLFLTKDGQFLLNEINPIPGCTPNSLFPKMCATGGLSTPELITKLCEEALGNKLKKDRAC